MSHSIPRADPNFRNVALSHTDDEPELAEEVRIEDEHSELLESLDQSNNQPVDQSVSQTITLPISQPANQSISHTPGRLIVGSLLKPALSSDPIHRSITSSPNLSIPIDPSLTQYDDESKQPNNQSNSQSNSRSNSRPGSRQQSGSNSPTHKSSTQPADDQATNPTLNQFDNAGEMLVKPTEMDQAELESHIGEMTSRINQQSINQTANQSGNQQIIITPGKHDRMIKTVFGFTLHCKCTIIDEVRMTVWILVILGAVLGLAFFFAKMDYQFDAAELKLHERFVALLVGGIFSFLACVLSFLQIRDHRRHWVHPPSQRCVIKILLMVPVYAVSAWMSLLFLKYSLYIDFVRLCYEALVIYQFMILLTKYLGGQAGVVEWLKTKSELKWPTPLCCLPPVQPGARFMTGIKYGTLQYAVISPFVSVIAMALNTFDLYGDGVFDFTRGYVYVMIIQNFTQLTSLYCLVWLYVTMKNELQPFSPMAKFLVVKSVVFFTFWQSVLLAVLVKLSVVTETSDLDVGEVQIGLQDFIICIEMFIAAAVHKYTFGVEKYKNGAMKLLMDERALYLARLSYERAVEQQKKAREQVLEEERAKAGLKKKKKKKKNRSKSNDHSSYHSVDTEHHIDIDSQPMTPVLDPTRFNNDDDEALVESSRPQTANRSMIQFRIGDFDAVETTDVGHKTGASPFKPSNFKHAPPSFAKAMGKAAMTVAKTGKTLMAPVTKGIEMIGLIDKYDEALIDEDWDESRQRPVMLTREQREEIEEQVRKEKEEKMKRKSLKQSRKKQEAMEHMQEALASQSSVLLDQSNDEHHDDDDIDLVNQSNIHQSSDSESDSDGEIGFEARAASRQKRSGHALVNQDEDY